MELTEIKAEGLSRTYNATAAASEIAAKVNAKIEDVRATAQLKGFRKGKAPRNVLKRMFGKSVLGEVTQELVDQIVSNHLEASGHRPYGRPDVKLLNEDYKEGDDLKIEIAYEMLPDIDEPDYRALKLERLIVTVEDEVVDTALADLAARAPDYAAKDGAVEASDQVVIDFVGRVNGEAFDGGSGDDVSLTVGSGRFIPGFEDQLIGARAEETREVRVTFPTEYQVAALAGADAVFDVVVKEVRAPAPPEIGVALAQKYGLETLEALKSRVREQTETEYKSASRIILKRALLDALNTQVSFELPPRMVSSEAEAVARQLSEADAASAGQEGADGTGDAAVAPTPEHTELAVRRVKLGLLLAEIGRKAGIAVSDQEVEQALVAQAQKYGAQAREFYDFAIKSPPMREQIRAPIFEEKVVDYVIELADVEDKSVSVETLKAKLKEIEEDEAPDADASAS